MRYLLAIILPPVAVAFSAGVTAFLANLLLTLCFFVPGIIHAILILNGHYADTRHQEMIHLYQQAIAAEAGIELINPRTAKMVGWIVLPLALIGLLFVALLAWGIWNAQP